MPLAGLLVHCLAHSFFFLSYFFFPIWPDLGTSNGSGLRTRNFKSKQWPQRGTRDFWKAATFSYLRLSFVDQYYYSLRIFHCIYLYVSLYLLLGEKGITQDRLKSTLREEKKYQNLSAFKSYIPCLRLLSLDVSHAPGNWCPMPL